MSEIFSRGMAVATRLTQSGKLAEATALIQSVLRGSTSHDDASTSRSPSPQPGIDPGIQIEGTATELSSTTEAAGSTPEQSVKMNGGASRQFDLKRVVDQPILRRLRARDVEAKPSHSQGKFVAGLFGNAAGQRAYKLYIPTSHHRGRRPLIVMLHGCSQSPDDFANGTRMNVCAEEHGCFVVYPEQTSAANASKCWNWFNSSEQQRGRGEPSIIADLTLDLIKTQPIDPTRIYIAGLSAGGAAAAILGERYADLYAAVGVHSGLACGAARDMTSAFMAMSGHGPSTRSEQTLTGDVYVPTIVFHGDNDRTVHPRNGGEVITRASRSADLQSLTENGEANGRSFTRAVHRDGNGKAVIEEWVIHGAGHAWSGGSTSGSFADATGPDASREMLRFFLAQSRPAGS